MNEQIYTFIPSLLLETHSRMAGLSPPLEDLTQVHLFHETPPDNATHPSSPTSPHTYLEKKGQCGLRYVGFTMMDLGVKYCYVFQESPICGILGK